MKHDFFQKCIVTLLTITKNCFVLIEISPQMNKINEKIEINASDTLRLIFNAEMYRFKLISNKIQQQIFLLSVTKAIVSFLCVPTYKHYKTKAILQ